jgi:Flp pilus assembly pilin Flp
MSDLTRTIRQFVSDENGATAVEYCLLCSLIFLAVVPAVDAVANSTIAMYNVIIGAM